MNENFTTEEVFNSAVSIVRNLPKEGSIKPSDELKLKLYAYYKQATHGKNETPKPRFYQLVEVYKWDAWYKLGDMTKEEAMLNYIQELKQIMGSIPGDETDTEANKQFEDVLGKRFYDYWFTQLKHSSDMKNKADTQSNSSNGSSMSLLEETQSAGDGYKTPSSVAFKESFATEISDQIAMAVLRLQHGLDKTITRLNKIEDRLEQAINATKPKKTTIEAVHWFYLSYPFLVYFIIRALERRNKK